MPCVTALESPRKTCSSPRVQQALDLLGRIFINRGDHILVENPTYLGAIQAWNAVGAEFVPVPMDNDAW